MNERLGTPNVEIGHLQKMVSAVSRDRRPFRDLALSAGAEWYPQFKRVLFGLPKGLAEDELMASWVMKGSEVSAVHGGLEIAQKMKELHPDLVLVDIAMPNLEKSGLERLKELAKDRNRTIIFTGEIVETALALLRGSSEKKHKAKEITRESEKAGG